MKILAVSGILFASFFGIVGCQCHTWGDRYSDLIDDIGDHKAEWDNLYNPCLDISRLGKPDWCRCRWNRLLCPRACEASGYCTQCDAVDDAEPGVEIPQGESQANPPQETEMPPALPLERPPAPGKLRPTKPKRSELPLELPPKPGKKKAGHGETFEE